MIAKQKSFKNAKFSSAVLVQAHALFQSHLHDDHKAAYASSWHVGTTNGEQWDFDNESEFFAEYRKATTESASLHRQHEPAEKDSSIGHSVFGVRFHGYSWGVDTTVSVTLGARSHVEDVFNVFEEAHQASILPMTDNKSAVRVYIGHGRGQDWTRLRDHLRDIHGHEVVAYETGPRAGLSITQILSDMVDEATIAFLVLTAEDEGADGVWRARENVIHETGLFQGRLGWERTIVLLEDGCNEFTNLAGNQQLRYPGGHIQHVYGDVLGVIKREFG